MYFKNGFFSSIGGFFKKVVTAPFRLSTYAAKKVVGFAGGLAGGLIKQLGIKGVQLPFGLGGVEFDPVTGEPTGVGGGGTIGVELSGMDKIKQYLPIIIIGVGAVLLFTMMKK